MNHRILTFALLASLITSQPASAHSGTCSCDHTPRIASTTEQIYFMALPIALFALLAGYNYYYGTGEHTNACCHEHDCDHDHSSCNHAHESSSSWEHEAAPEQTPYAVQTTQQEEQTPTAPAPEPSSPAAAPIDEAVTPDHFDHVFNPESGSVHELSGW